MKLSIIFTLCITLVLYFYSCKKVESQVVATGDEPYYDVVIIGGGISGLTSAYYLKDKNIMLLEKEDKCGGRVISGTWEGFHYPKGMEYIGPPEKEYKQLFNELGLSLIEVPPPTDGVAYQGNFYHNGNILNFLPSQSAKDNYYDLMEKLNLLSKEVENAIWEDRGDLADFENLDAMSVDEWLKANNYDTLVQRLVDVENRGLFGASNKDLSMLFNVDEMAYDLPDSTEYTESEVYTFQNGMIELVDAITNRLEGKITTGATATQVQVNSDMSVTIKYQKKGETKIIHADCVIFATPAHVTASLAINGFSSEVIEGLRSIQYSQYITLNLFTSERLYTDSWMLSCLDDYFVTIYDATRTQVAENYTGKSIMGLYIAPKDASDKSLSTISENELLERTYTSLEKYYPDIRSKVMGYDIQRFEDAFPVFSKNYHRTLLSIMAPSSTRGPLFIVGDYTMYATFDGAFWSAKDAVEEVIDYLKE